MKKYLLGIDVGGTKTAYGVYDSERNLVLKRRVASDPTLSASSFFDGIVREIGSICAEMGISSEHLEGIGIGMPSYVRQMDGYIIKTVNLTNIMDFPAKRYLQNKLGDNVRIVLDNDARTAALAEHRHGAGHGFDNMLYCPVSTGISSGMIIGGELFRGSYGWAGESGHMIITPGEGVLCGCGNRGCFMSWCSGSMIVKHIRKWIAEGEETMMTALAGGEENITTVHLNEAYEKGDPMAIKALNQMAHYMAVWIYNVYVTLNINCFVFGGGLLSMGDKLFGPVRMQFDEYNQHDAHPVYFKNAELTQDFGLIGAVELLL